MTALPEPRPIRDVGVIDRRTFDEEIRSAGQPVVMRGLGADWPAVTAAKQSPESAVDYLKSFPAARDVVGFLGAPEIEGRFFYTPDYQGLNFNRGNVSLAAFLDRLLRDQAAERPFSLAVQSEIIQQLLPGFVEANRIPLVDAEVQPRIWIGNQVRVAPHYDLMENVGVVMAGRRRFTLFPPEQLPNLYMGPIEVTPAGTPVSLVDLEEPDLARFPRYAEAAKHAQSVVLEPGDGIYIPFHWWHGVDSLDKVNAFINYWWNDAQPGMGSPYDALLHALFALRGLPEDQRKVWRMVFDNFVFMTEGDPVAHLPDSAKGALGPVDATQLARMRGTLKNLFGSL